MKWVKKDPKTF